MRMGSATEMAAIREEEMEQVSKVKLHILALP